MDVIVTSSCPLFFSFSLFLFPIFFLFLSLTANQFFWRRRLEARTFYFERRTVRGLWSIGIQVKSEQFALVPLIIDWFLSMRDNMRYNQLYDVLIFRSLTVSLTFLLLTYVLLVHVFFGISSPGDATTCLENERCFASENISSLSRSKPPKSSFIKYTHEIARGVGPKSDKNCYKLFFSVLCLSSCEYFVS